jgi:hypothetical protein
MGRVSVDARMNIATVTEQEPDEGNGPIVTIRDNMVALAVIVVLAASSMFITSHYHPWQVSSIKPTAHSTNSQTTVGCCASTSERSQRTPTSLTPCGCMDTRIP